MTALAANRNTVEALGGGRFITALIAASTRIYKGSLVAINTSGKAVAASELPAVKVIGVATAEYDNSSGLVDALEVTVMTGAFWFANSGDITAAHVGRVCYVDDDQTVSLASGTSLLSGTRPPAGTIRGVSSTLGVLVDVGNAKTMLIESILKFDDADVDVAATSMTRAVSGTLPIGARIMAIETDTTDWTDGSTGTFALALGDGTTAALYGTDIGNIDGGNTRVEYAGVGACRVATATALVATISGSVNIGTSTAGQTTLRIWIELP